MAVYLGDIPVHKEIDFGIMEDETALGEVDDSSLEKKGKVAKKIIGKTALQNREISFAELNHCCDKAFKIQKIQ